MKQNSLAFPPLFHEIEHVCVVSALYINIQNTFKFFCVSQKSWVCMTGARSMGSVPNTKLFINGKFVESNTKDWVDLHDPATNEVNNSTCCFVFCLIFLKSFKQITI